MERTARLSAIVMAMGFVLNFASAGPYTSEAIVPGYGFLGIHGLTFDSQDRLYVGSVVGQSIFRVDPETGDHELFEPPPTGMADDLEFGPDGTLVWTSFILGKIHARKGDGPLIELATGLPGMNSLAFKQDGRLFASQVFTADALHEIDPTGKNPPRKILENMGGLNGFDFGPDGMLYGPLWFKGKVVRIDVDTAELTVIADGMKIPAAVNFDSKGNLYVLDSGAGIIYRIDIESGEKTVVSEFKTAMDNLAFDSKDRLYVTVMAENGIYEINTKDGSARTVKEAQLSAPADIALIVADGRETVYIADTFAIHAVDTASGKTTSFVRTVEDDFEYAGGIDVTDRYVHAASWISGTVQTFDRETGKTLHTYHALTTPYDVLELGDGSLLVLQMFPGNLIHITGKGETDRKEVFQGLNMPVSLAKAGPDAVYISQYAAGNIVRVDLKTQQSTIVAEGLQGPEGLAIDAKGRIIVCETGAQQVTAIDPKTGKKQTLATKLPVGFTMPAGMPPVGLTSGVAVSPSGAIYVSSDIESALYRLKPDQNH